MTYTGYPQNGTLLLLSNATATGSAFEWYGGKGTFCVVGTFGGATVKLQMLGPDASTWVDVGSSTTLTAAGVGNFECAAGSIKAVITGGPPSGIYATAKGYVI